MSLSLMFVLSAALVLQISSWISSPLPSSNFISQLRRRQHIQIHLKSQMGKYLFWSDQDQRSEHTSFSTATLPPTTLLVDTLTFHDYCRQLIIKILSKVGYSPEEDQEQASSGQQMVFHGGLRSFDTLKYSFPIHSINDDVWHSEEQTIVAQHFQSLTSLREMIGTDSDALSLFNESSLPEGAIKVVFLTGGLKSSLFIAGKGDAYGHSEERCLWHKLQEAKISLFYKSGCTREWVDHLQETMAKRVKENEARIAHTEEIIRKNKDEISEITRAIHIINESIMLLRGHHLHCTFNESKADEELRYSGRKLKKVVDRLVMRCNIYSDSARKINNATRALLTPLLDITGNFADVYLPSSQINWIDSILHDDIFRFGEVLDISMQLINSNLALSNSYCSVLDSTSDLIIRSLDLFESNDDYIRSRFQTVANESVNTDSLEETILRRIISDFFNFLI